MKCSNAVSDDGRYVVSTVTGDFTAKEMLATVLEAYKFAEEHGITRQLADVTGARNVDSVSGNYDFAYAEFQAAVAFDRRLRVAILVSPDDHSHDFAETVMQNAGLNVAFFRDRDQAVAYLCSPESGEMRDPGSR